MWKPLIMSFDQKTLALLNVNCANPLTQRFAATTSPVLLNFHKLSPPMQDVKNKDLCCIVISSQKAAFPLISHENTHTHTSEFNKSVTCSSQVFHWHLLLQQTDD